MDLDGCALDLRAINLFDDFVTTPPIGCTHNISPAVLVLRLNSFVERRSREMLKELYQRHIFFHQNIIHQALSFHI